MPLRSTPDRSIEAKQRSASIEPLVFRRGVPISFSAALFLAALSYIVSDSPLAGIGILTLWVVWRVLGDSEGPPVLAFALSFQWFQIYIAIFYELITGRRVPEMEFCNYFPMVLVGSGCVLALTAGLALGKKESKEKSPGFASVEDRLPFVQILILYLIVTLSEGSIINIAWSLSGLTQILLSFRLARLALLFMVIRSLTIPRLHAKQLFVVLIFEIFLGLTGFFAGFRDSLLFAAMCLLEGGLKYRKAQYWIGLASALSFLILIATVWVSARTEIRRDWDQDRPLVERLGNAAHAGQNVSAIDWTGMDKMVSRTWTVYYPALAISRVPAVLPHTDGEILMMALKHVAMPRILFPDKLETVSDSEMVRKYSGVWVAGTEMGTSIAFGYAAESYVDFGLPWMFLPIFIYGLLIGRAYRWITSQITNIAIRDGVVTAVFWTILFLFERSWLKTIGNAITWLVVTAAFVYVLKAYSPAKRAAPVRSTRKNLLPP